LPLHLLLARRPGLNDDALRIADGVWRSGSLAEAGWSDGKDKELAGADGVQVVGVVPEELVDLVVGEQTGIVCDRIAAVEMEDLQSSRSADCKQFAGRRPVDIDHGAEAWASF
jgi:hypothetical protein